MAESVDDLVVGFFSAGVHGFAEDVGFEAHRLLAVPGTGKTAAGQRAPGNDGDAFGLAEADHLALFFAIEKVVVVLHGDESGPAVEAGEIEGLGELPCVH